MDRLSDCGAYVVRQVGDSVQVFTLVQAAALRAPPGCIAIPLTRGYVAIIDEVDARLAAYKWHTHFGARGKIYAKRNARIADGLGPRAVIYLHRAVLGVTAREVDVDHEDGDGLNCRRKNLRDVSHSENMRNTVGARSHSQSGILGVSKSSTNRWCARIGTRRIGHYDTADEARVARLDAERAEYGVQTRRAWAHEGEQ